MEASPGPPSSRPSQLCFCRCFFPCVRMQSLCSHCVQTNQVKWETPSGFGTRCESTLTLCIASVHAVFRYRMEQGPSSPSQMLGINSACDGARLNDCSWSFNFFHTQTTGFKNAICIGRGQLKNHIPNIKLWESQPLSQVVHCRVI